MPTDPAIPQLPSLVSIAIDPNPTTGLSLAPNLTSTYTMHFAMPPRKTSRPPPYAARQQSGFRIPPALKNLLRRDKLRVIVLGILGFLTVFWLLGRIGGGSSNTQAAHLPKVAIGSGPPVVIVTVLDPKADQGWTAKIQKNREDYAKRHGTSLHLKHPTDWNTNI